MECGVNYTTEALRENVNGLIDYASGVHVEDMTALRLLEPTEFITNINLVGHTISGVGGGNFYYDTTDTTSPDNNGTVIVTLEGKRWKRSGLDFSLIPATWFGLFDGATESVCSAAVQGIVDWVEANPHYNSDNSKEGWCTTIQFPAGRFPLSEVRIKKFNFIIEGVGSGTYLINENATGRMLHVEEGTSNTLGGFIMRDLHIRNVVLREDGAGEIVYLNLPVRGGMFDVTFTSSAINVGGRSKLGGDMLKTVSPFEFLCEGVTFWGCGIGWDIISGPQSDTFDCQGVVFNECTIGMIGFRGAGGSGNNNFKFSGKFIAQQGGTYVSGGKDAFAITSVVSTSGNLLTVTDATNILSGRAVVVGDDNTAEVAIIKSINVNELTLDRPITKSGGTRVLSGKIGVIVIEMRNPSFEGVQIEGCDIGALLLKGSRNVTFDGYSIIGTAKGVYASSVFRRLNMLNGSGGTSGTMRNGVAYKILTLDDNIESDANKIYMNNIAGEGSGYFDDNLTSLIDNVGGFFPFIQIDSRLTGDTHMGDNSASAIELTNKSYLTFNRTTTGKFSRVRWRTADIDQWFLNHTGSGGDLGFRKSGLSVDSMTLLQSSGDIRCGSGVWSDPLFRVGSVRFWVEGVNVRAKASAPSSAIDGVIVVTL
ncbi:hypothetical protein S14_138 [Shewanella sp. phage 1/4]|uniref:hypothetical protein n=1 Tax=Shewanella phage 1/4 TaxID=1458859 RepID=UPI0004F72B32|nr:hypothetical protein S14_138 [Shewanella sp. phage 1/4]AHK11247.1 hypothetical protein S14_138 [Shewanella sp. phage 1/4]